MKSIEKYLGDLGIVWEGIYVTVARGFLDVAAVCDVLDLFAAKHPLSEQR